MKKLFLLISLCLMASVVLKAQVTRTMSITAGMLSSKLSATEKNTVTELYLGGTIDARDVRCMRDEMPALRILDLRFVTIVAYTGTGGTYQGVSTAYPENEMPQFSFYNGITTVSKTSLNYVNLPNNITSIGYGAFLHCYGLAGSLLNGSVACSLVIPSTVTNIGWYAFTGCSKLNGDLSIPSSVTTIGNAAFYECTGFSNLIIPGSVISIVDRAFQGCTGLTSIYVYSSAPIDLSLSPAALTGINTTTCKLYVPYGSKSAYQLASQWNNFTNIFEIVKTINLTTPGTLSSVLTATEKSGLKSVIITGNIDVRDVKCLRDEMTVLQALDLSGATIVSYTGLAGTIGGTSSTAYPANEMPQFSFYNGITTVSKTSLTSVKLPNWITSIGYGAFLHCYGLTGNLVIPSTVKDIGSYAFSGCSKLTGELIIPNSTTTIGNAAFYECSGFSNLIIPSSVVSIVDRAFQGCIGLTSIYAYPATPIDLSLSPAAFTGVNTSTCKLYIPVGSKSAYQMAPQWKDFANTIEYVKTVNITTPGTLSSMLTTTEKSGLKSIYITGNIDARDIKCLRDEMTALATVDLSGTSISAYTGLAGTVGGTTATVYPANEMPQYSFCTTTNVFKSSLSTVTLPNSITSIGNYAFRSCSGLTGNLIIPNSVTTIGNGAFTMCKGLTGYLNLPSSIVSIGDYAFNSCLGFVGNLTIPNSVTTIGSFCFNGCSGFKRLTLSNSILSIGTYAFANCIGLSGDLTIPISIKSIGDYAFYNAIKLTSIHVYPTMPIDLSSAVNALYGVNRSNCLYVPIGTKVLYQSANVWKNFSNIVEMVKVVNLTSAGTLSNQLSVNEKLGLIGIIITGVVDDRDIKCLRDELVMLESLDLSASNIITYSGMLGTYVGGSNPVITYPANEMPQFSFSDVVTTVGKTTLNSIKLPNSSTSIGYGAFLHCYGLTGKLVIPSSVSNIGWYAFVGCSKLSGDLTIPNSVKTIGNAAFYECSGFTGSLVIPNSVTSIGERAFSYCNGFTTLTIPTSVTSIGYSAFNTCSGLNSIYAYPTNPIDLNSSPSTFEGVNMSTCKLYVPIGSKSAYQAASQWKDFVNIIEMSVLKVTAEKKDEISKDASNDVKIFSSVAGLLIEGITPGEMVRVYDVTGNQLCVVKSDRERILVSVPKGAMYIVKTTKGNMKVLF